MAFSAEYEHPHPAELPHDYERTVEGIARSNKLEVVSAAPTCDGLHVVLFSPTLDPIEFQERVARFAEALPRGLAAPRVARPPQAGVVISGNNVTGGSIVVGTQVNGTAPNWDEARALVAGMKRALEALPSDAPRPQDVLAEVETLGAQLQRTEPKPEKMKSTLEDLKSALQLYAAANATIDLWGKVAPMLHGLAAIFG